VLDASSFKKPKSHQPLTYLSSSREHSTGLGAWSTPFKQHFCHNSFVVPAALPTIHTFTCLAWSEITSAISAEVRKYYKIDFIGGSCYFQPAIRLQQIQVSITCKSILRGSWRYFWDTQTSFMEWYLLAGLPLRSIDSQSSRRWFFEHPRLEFYFPFEVLTLVYDVKIASSIGEASACNVRRRRKAPTVNNLKCIAMFWVECCWKSK